jgi:hypothetical protein
LILISEKRRGYSTIQDISSVYFTPELAPSFQPKLIQGQPVVELTRKNLATNQYGSAPSITEEALKAKAQGSPQMIDRFPPQKELSRSLKGLASPLMTKLGFHNAASPSQLSQSTNSNINSPNFELYMNSNSEKTKLKVSCPVELTSSLIAKTQDPLLAGQQHPVFRGNFAPNIYNKIEISYITNNFPSGNTSEMPYKPIEASAGISQPTNPLEPSCSLNESYTIDVTKFKDSQAPVTEMDRSMPLEPREKVQYHVEGHLSQSYALQTSGTDLRTHLPDELCASERPSVMVEAVSPRPYHFKDEAQYRSLHELSPSKKPKQSSQRGSPSSFLQDLNQPHLAKETVKSQLLPPRDSDKKESIFSKYSDGNPLAKLSFLTKLDKISQRIPLDLTKGSKASTRKSKTVLEENVALQKLNQTDTKAKISKKINNIFKRFGKNLTEELTRVPGTFTKEKNNLSNTSLGLDTKNRGQSTSSVHDLMKRLGARGSLRTSMVSTSNPLDVAWSRLRTSRGKQSSLSQTRTSKSKQSEARNPDRTEVSIYKAKDSPSHDDYSPKDGARYNLLYRSDKNDSQRHEVGHLLSVQDKVFPSVLDAARKLFLRQSPTSLSLLSKTQPSQLLNQLADAVRQLWTGKDLTLSSGEHYSLTVKLGKNSFILRVEGIEDLEGLYTIAVYPKSTPSRTSYLRHVAELFKFLDV